MPMPWPPATAELTAVATALTVLEEEAAGDSTTQQADSRQRQRWLYTPK
jgi:hypothetical protein